LSLGTPHYMSPEQATGDVHVGAATDIYALGCVLYEMLVGEPPYTGSTPQAVLGKIVTGEPDPVTKHRRAVVPHVEAAIQKALEKVPADRFASAKDFAIALSDAGFRHRQVTERAEAPRRWNGVAVTATVVAVLAVGVAAAALLSAPGSAALPVVRFSVPLGEGSGLALGGANDVGRGRPAATSLALSPDGALLVYSAWRANDAGELESRLYSRRVDQEQAAPIAGTDGASGPFFSPDGLWLGFFIGRSLRRVRIDGGSVETIVAEADVPVQSRGASWGDDGTILYGGIAGLYRVAASGGVPSVVAEEPSEGYQSSAPFVLPGSRAALFTGWEPGNPEDAGIVAVDLATGVLTPLVSDAMQPRYLTSGHLLFVRSATLMAVRFDAERLELIGEPFLVLDGVVQALRTLGGAFETGAAQVAVSGAGHLAYALGGLYPEPAVELVRVRLDGSEEPLGVPRGFTTDLRASPDGGRLAFINVLEGVVGGGNAIGVYDLVRGVPIPLNTGFRRNSAPNWSADGRWIAFVSDLEDGTRALYRIPSDGSGEPEPLASPTGVIYSWSAEGPIAYERDGDIWILPPDGDPAPFFISDVEEFHATFSPDGHWLAYVSSQSGRNEVYVRPYPEREPATRVSVDGGSAPTWSPDGRRVYFRSPGVPAAMMVADLTEGQDLRVAGVDTLVSPWLYGASRPTRSYDVFPDGSFLAGRILGGDRETRDAAASVHELHVVLNFAEELRARDRE